MDILEKAEKLLNEGKPRKALDLLKKTKKDDAFAEYLKAEASRVGGDFHAAITHYDNARRGHIEDPELAVNILNGMAACLRTLGKSEPAYTFAHEAGRIAQEYELEDAERHSRLEMAMALRAKGNLEQSRALLEMILTEFEELGDSSGSTYIHWALGGIFRLQGKFAQSVAEFKKAVALAKKDKDETSLGYGYFGLAGVSRVAGDIAGSEKYYRIAADIFKDSEDLFARAYVNCGLANALRQKGAHDEAYTRYQEADKLYSKINDEPDLGFVKWGLGNILVKRGKLKEAMKQFEKALALFEKYDEKRGELLTRLSIASLTYLLGDAEAADRIYDAAVAEAKNEGLHTYLETLT